MDKKNRIHFIKIIRDEKWTDIIKDLISYVIWVKILWEMDHSTNEYRELNYISETNILIHTIYNLYQFAAYLIGVSSIFIIFNI